MAAPGASTPSRDDGWRTFAKLGAPHGLYGEQALHLAEGWSDDLVTLFMPPEEPGDPPAAPLRLSLRNTTRPIAIADARWHAGRIMVRLAGVESREAAREYIHGLLEAPIEVLRASLGADAVIEDDLVGIVAFDPEGRSIGTVAGLETRADNAWLLIRWQDDAPGDAPDLIPFVKAIVPTVDLAARRVVLEVPEGLKGLNRRAADAEAASPPDGSAPSET